MRPAQDSAAAAGAQALAAAMLGLGALFIARPRPAARLFGVPIRGSGEDYVRALGVRDLALASGLGVASRASPKALAAVSGVAAAIPIADAVLIGARGRSPLAVLLHASSAVALALLAVCAWRSRYGASGKAGALPGLDPGLADLS